MKRINHKKILRSLNQTPADKIFLASFREQLQTFIVARPIEKNGFFVMFTKTATIFGLVLFFLFSGSGLVYASQSSLPGQWLYPVKITAEKTRLAMAIKPDKKKKLQREFIDTRIKEVKTISDKKNSDNNAALALEIIDKKIKELDEESSQEIDIKNIQETNKLLSENASSSTSTVPTIKEKIKIKLKKDSRFSNTEKDKDDLRRNKEKLQESRTILRNLLKKDRRQDIENKINADIKVESRRPTEINKAMKNNNDTK